MQNAESRGCFLYSFCILHSSFCIYVFLRVRHRHMEIKKGIGVSPGVVISTAVVLDAEDLLIPRRHVEAGEIEREIGRFKAAIEKSMQELLELRDRVTEKYSKEIGGIFNVHIAILNDRSVVEPV